MEIKRVMQLGEKYPKPSQAPESMCGMEHLKEAGREAQRLGPFGLEKRRLWKDMSGIHKIMKMEDRVNAELIFPKSCSTRS